MPFRIKMKISLFLQKNIDNSYYKLLQMNHVFLSINKFILITETKSCSYNVLFEQETSYDKDNV